MLAWVIFIFVANFTLAAGVRKPSNLCRICVNL